MVLVAVVLAVRHTLAEAEHRLHLIDLGDLIGSGLLALFGTAVSVQPWRVALADLGSSPPFRIATRVYFIGQIAKYLPGSVWPVATQAQLLRRYDVPRTRTATASIFVMALALLVGLIVAAVTLPLGHPGSLTHYAWVFAFLPIGLVVLAPRVFNWLLALALRLVRRAPMEGGLSLGGVSRAGAWDIIVWVSFGTSIWLLARPLGAGSARDLLLCIGAFALAWAVGFLIVFAPAGGVAREAALTALLLPVLTQPSGLAVALVSRLLFTIADILLGAAAWAYRPRQVINEPEPECDGAPAAS